MNFVYDSILIDLDGLTLVPGDSAQPPEKEGDALCELLLEVAPRGKAIEGALEMLLPVALVLEAGDHRRVGEDAVAERV